MKRIAPVSFLLLFGLFYLALLLKSAGASFEKVDKILVIKSKRLMVLFRNDQVLRAYNITLGRNPKGHKTKQGDKRTPEGAYIIDYRNEKSRYYRSLHISYPNAADLLNAGSQGVAPGADIMIHGLPNGIADRDIPLTWDWTAGCIAVTNREMQEIWELVPDGTPIEIRP
ncbi:MAG: L,D-transpeptidase family protein [Nitrospirota bacterium]